MIAAITDISLEGWLAVGGFLLTAAGILVFVGKALAKLDVLSSDLTEFRDDHKEMVQRKEADHKEFWKAITETSRNIQNLTITATQHEGRLTVLERHLERGERNH